MTVGRCDICRQNKHVQRLVSIDVDTGCGLKYTVDNSCPECRSVLATAINKAVETLRDRKNLNSS